MEDMLVENPNHNPASHSFLDGSDEGNSTGKDEDQLPGSSGSEDEDQI